MPGSHEMKRCRRTLLPIAFLLFPFLALGAAPLDEAVRVERGGAVPMRDGGKLIADVYLPPGKGPWPVILIRTPYNRAAGGGAAQPFRAHYAVVGQGTRGRGGSGGGFTPLLSRVY